MLNTKTEVHSYSELSTESVPKRSTLFVISKIREILEKVTAVTLSHVPVRFANKEIKNEHLSSTFLSIS